MTVPSLPLHLSNLNAYVLLPTRISHTWTCSWTEPTRMAGCLDLNSGMNWAATALDCMVVWFHLIWFSRGIRLGHCAHCTELHIGNCEEWRTEQDIQISEADVSRPQRQYFSRICFFPSQNGRIGCCKVYILYSFVCHLLCTSREFSLGSSSETIGSLSALRFSAVCMCISIQQQNYSSGDLHQKNWWNCGVNASFKFA